MESSSNLVLVSNPSSVSASRAKPNLDSASATAPTLKLDSMSAPTAPEPKPDVVTAPATAANPRIALLEKQIAQLKAQSRTRTTRAPTQPQAVDPSLTITPQTANHAASPTSTAAEDSQVRALERQLAALTAEVQAMKTNPTSSPPSATPIGAATSFGSCHC